MRHGVETILLAIAAAARQRRSEVIRSLAELGVKVPKVPELGEVLSGQATLADRRDVSVADVLGREVVAAAQDEGFSIQPLVGPVSLMLALAASGLDGQSFAFAGYAPSDAALRTTFLRQLERTALASGQTQILIETPYRNASLFEALMVTLAASTRLCVASGLTTVDAHVATKKVASWRSTASAAGSRDLKTLLEAPCVFVIGP